MKRWPGRQNKTEMPGNYNRSLTENTVNDPHNSHFSFVQITWCSPNYRFTTLRFEQRSALKWCIWKKKREVPIFYQCKMTLLHWTKPLLCNLSFCRGNMLTPVLSESAQHSCTQPQLMALQQRQPFGWKEHSNFISCSWLCKEEIFQGVLNPCTQPAWDSILQLGYPMILVLCHRDGQLEILTGPAG